MPNPPSDSELPAIRRVVTGHDESGSAIFESIEHIVPEPIAEGGASFATLWSTDRLPADNNDPTDGRARVFGLMPEHGSVIRIVDTLPGGSSPMHRTHSLDFGIVIYGQIELQLDSGTTQILGPGDVIIQRGTNHLWRNPSQDVPCRIAFVMIDALPYQHKGKALPEMMV